MSPMDYPLHQLPVLHMVPGARPPEKMMKERKDKNAPKRNWTAYQFFVEEVCMT